MHQFLVENLEQMTLMEYPLAVHIWSFLFSTFDVFIDMQNYDRVVL